MQYRRFPRVEDVRCLAQQAERFRQEAELLQCGAREKALLKARQAKRESQLIEWLRLVQGPEPKARPPR
jgi:hypothetical protein